MQRYKLIIAYDGSAYAGWQVQPGQRTIQGELEKALLALTGARVKTHGSGRTDQGVHAVGQCAHVDLEQPLERGAVLKALNALLPADIRVLRVARAAADFHARRDAVGKEYRYFIWNDVILPPYLRLYHTHESRPLDVGAMRAAAAALKGRHDFAAFTANPHRLPARSAPAKAGEVASTVRELSELAVRRRGREVVIVARSDGFLYKMVRSLAGFLIQVGIGAATPADAERILQSRERTARVPTAPPQGLFLWRVSYSAKARGTARGRPPPL